MCTQEFPFVFCHQLKWPKSPSPGFTPCPFALVATDKFAAGSEVPAGFRYILTHALGLGERKECSERNVSGGALDHIPSPAL